MTDYKIEKRGKEHIIREVRTGYCIVKMRSKDQAYRLIRHLNLGGGFGGDTPLFFVDPLLRKLNSTAEVC